MLIPQQLQLLSAQTLEAMRSDPTHDVSLKQRFAIYHAFGDLPIGAQALLRLHLLTARYILPLWHAAWPHNLLADQTLETAENILLRKENIEIAKRTLYDVSMVLNQEIPDGLEYYRAYYALYASYETLLAMLMGSERPCDTAHYAAVAAAGGWAEEHNSDLQKRQVFWEWWLTEAISQAWEQAESTPYLQADSPLAENDNFFSDGVNYYNNSDIFRDIIYISPKRGTSIDNYIWVDFSEHLEPSKSSAVSPADDNIFNNQQDVLYDEIYVCFQGNYFLSVFRTPSGVDYQAVVKKVEYGKGSDVVIAHEKDFATLEQAKIACIAIFTVSKEMERDTK